MEKFDLTGLPELDQHVELKTSMENARKQLQIEQYKAAANELRQGLEYIIDCYMEAAGQEEDIPPGTTSLFSRIEFLKNGDWITYAQADAFHSVRMRCNTGVHRNSGGQAKQLNPVDIRYSYELLVQELSGFLNIFPKGLHSDVEADTAAKQERLSQNWKKQMGENGEEERQIEDGQDADDQLADADTETEMPEWKSLDKVQSKLTQMLDVLKVQLDALEEEAPQDLGQLDSEQLDSEQLDSEQLDSGQLDSGQLDSEQLDFQQLSEQTEKLAESEGETESLETENLETEEKPELERGEPVPEKELTDSEQKEQERQRTEPELEERQQEQKEKEKRLAELEEKERRLAELEEKEKRLAELEKKEKRLAELEEKERQLAEQEREMARLNKLEEAEGLEQNQQQRGEEEPEQEMPGMEPLEELTERLAELDELEEQRAKQEQRLSGEDEGEPSKKPKFSLLEDRSGEATEGIFSDMMKDLFKKLK